MVASLVVAVALCLTEGPQTTHRVVAPPGVRISSHLALSSAYMQLLQASRSCVKIVALKEADPSSGLPGQPTRWQ